MIIDDMVKCAKEVNGNETILAKVALTQCVLESNWGKSLLASKYNNYFGIKGKGTNGSINLKTKESYDGKTLVDAKDYFAVNTSMKDSFLWHKQLMLKDRYHPVRTATTVEEAFTQLYKCGYATDPNYSKKLLSTYNTSLKKYFK